MASRNTQNSNLLITLILLIVLISIIFLTFKVYNLYSLNHSFEKKLDNYNVNYEDVEENIVFMNDNINLIPQVNMQPNRWHFWPSNWSWTSGSELGKNNWQVNKYNGLGYKGGVAERPFGNYCPYAGSCPLGEWKGCPYGEGCSGPSRLPFEEIAKMPSFQSSFD